MLVPLEELDRKTSEVLEQFKSFYSRVEDIIHTVKYIYSATFKGCDISTGGLHLYFKCDRNPDFETKVKPFLDVRQLNNSLLVTERGSLKIFITLNW